MIVLLDSLHREDSPVIHTLHPAVLSTTRIEKCQLLRHEYKQGQGLQTDLKWRITSNTTVREMETVVVGVAM